MGFGNQRMDKPMRAVRRSFLAVALGSPAFLSGGTMAQAQTSAQLVSQAPRNDADVLARQRPDYDAKGLPLGAFRLFPQVALRGSYDTNVFRQQLVRRSDTYVNIAPSASLRSEWANHAIEAHASTDIARYSKLSSEDTTDYNFGGAGRLDVLRSLQLTADGDYSWLHEPRSSPDSPGFAASPTEYSLTLGNFEVAYQPNRFGILVGGGVAGFDYRPTALLTTPTTVQDNDDRDRSVYTGYAKVSYEFSPGYSAFLRGAYNKRNFERAVDRSGYDRSSDGYRVNLGVDMMLGNLLRGGVSVGYIQQNYNSLPGKTLPNFSGVDFAGALDWYATQLTTVRLQASRTVNDTTLSGASGSDDKSVRLAVDHELLRNVLLHADARYIDSTFKGLGRNDKIFVVGAGANYLLNSYLSLGLRYAYEARDSNVPGQDYNDSVVSLSTSAHL
jgi:hypothetical protein